MSQTEGQEPDDPEAEAGQKSGRAGEDYVGDHNPERGPDPGTMDRDVFGSVYGHDGAKTFIGAALRSGDVHVALEGPPGSGKSAFLLALESNVPGVIYRDGDQITPSRLRDVLADDPPILLIDEIDALDNEAYDALSTPLEHGRVVRDSAREQYDVEVGTQVIAACNDLADLPEHIANRFQPLRFEKYGEQEYVDLCSQMLIDEVEWVTTEQEARTVAKKVLTIRGKPDPRAARDVAQMASSVEEIGNLAKAMENPDADVEAPALRPGDIARAEGEVAKVRLRETMVEDMMHQAERANEPDEDVDEETARQMEEEIEEAVEEAVG